MEGVEERDENGTILRKSQDPSHIYYPLFYWNSSIRWFKGNKGKLEIKDMDEIARLVKF